jgi:hypothetical protein
MGGTFDIRVAGLLLLVAFLSGALLYIPNWVIARKVPNLPTLTGNVADIRTALIDAIGQNRLTDITTALDNLRTQLINLDGRFNANGDVGTAMQATRDLLTSGAVGTSLNGITTQLTTGDVRKKLDDIFAQLDANGDLRKKLDTIDGKLSKQT